MTPRPFYHRVTDGIRITVRPSFREAESSPTHGQYVFAYAVRIENIGEQPAQLLTRHWRIHDSIGEDTEVAGDGVVGAQPLIAPGRVHEYQSFCVLKSPSGHMEGVYRFVRPDGSRFDAAIPRFLLRVDPHLAHDE
ncbi:MAG: Co2+/Mg2+ efflux protein ApaG [Gemmatimonadaceae bacterium]|nr:Co2+/Mg2+ efflux protein ApaG [Gemmatimonadaceae bacterium]